jgi:hypothetical protein
MEGWDSFYEAGEKRHHSLSTLHPIPEQIKVLHSGNKGVHSFSKKKGETEPLCDLIV